MWPLTHDQAKWKSAKQKDSETYSRLQKMKTPVSPRTFALKSWRPKEWFYTSSNPEASLTMLSPKHCGTVKGRRSLVPTPFPLVSDSLGHPDVTENDWGQNGKRQVFSPSLVIIISALQMGPVILLCCIFWKIFKVERTQSRYCFRTGTF